MGESASTESQPSKLCSWMIFPRGFQVKEKSPPILSSRKLLSAGDLRECLFYSTFAGCGELLVRRAEDFPLIDTKTAAYTDGSRLTEDAG